MNRGPGATSVGGIAIVLVGRLKFIKCFTINRLIDIIDM